MGIETQLIGFKSYNSCKFVQFANGDKAQVLGRGSLEVGGTQLDNVLQVANAHFNLLSAHKLIAQLKKPLHLSDTSGFIGPLHFSYESVGLYTLCDRQPVAFATRHESDDE